MAANRTRPRIVSRSTGYTGLPRRPGASKRRLSRAINKKIHGVSREDTRGFPRSFDFAVVFFGLWRFRLWSPLLVSLFRSPSPPCPRPRLPKNPHPRKKPTLSSKNVRRPRRPPPTARSLPAPLPHWAFACRQSGRRKKQSGCRGHTTTNPGRAVFGRYLMRLHGSWPPSRDSSQCGSTRRKNSTPEPAACANARTRI